MTDLIIPSRFCGPPSSGNGGYSAGAISAYAGAECPDDHARPWPAVTVSLLAPPPLEVSMSLAPGGDMGDDGGVVATYDGKPFLSARCSHDEVTDVEPVAPDEAREAMASYSGLTSHPFPTCFSCGTGREPGDGLRIFPGPVGDGRVAATWTPDPSVAGDWHEYRDATREVGHAVTWAALDCTGGWAADIGERLMVLGTMTARLYSLPAVGTEHVVVGEPRGESGRKRMSAASLYDATGRLVGAAEHVWIAVDPATFN
jgi:hypothetical protein